jgi:hypothetical protein
LTATRSSGDIARPAERLGALAQALQPTPFANEDRLKTDAAKLKVLKKLAPEQPGAKKLAQK